MTEAKPATDEEITAIRMTLPEQAHQMSPAALVMQLIARIDTERAARLAAEARVKVLDDQLKRKRLPRPKRKAQMVNDPDLHELADVWKDKDNG